MFDWKRITKNGEFPFICSTCQGEEIVEYCPNCVKNVRISALKFYQRKNVKFICDTCKENVKERMATCSSDKCNWKCKWMFAYNKFENFNSSNEYFKCHFCTDWFQCLKTF